MTDNQQGVCRDFLRNVCTRGIKCKFLHPPGVSFLANHNPQQERIKFSEYFCHDFQNAECRRDDCKFVHCTRKDEEHFLGTGSLSAQVVDEAIAKSVTPCLPGETPVCREYLSGECRRGKSCKYRHLSLCKYRKELDFLYAFNLPKSDPCEHHEAKKVKTSFVQCCNVADNSFYANQVQNAPTSGQPCGHHSNNHILVSAPRHPCQMVQLSYASEGCCDRSQISQEPHLTMHSTSLQEENAVLKKQVFDLRRQLSDLMTANEFLLEQNAALRLMRKNGGLMAAPSIQPQVSPIVASVPVSIAPVSVPGSALSLTTVAMANGTTSQQLVPVSCNAAGQQIIPVTVAAQTGQQIMSVTVAGQATQQIIPVTMATTSGSPAIFSSAVPVSVPVSAVPVSLATMSMAPMQMSSFVQASSTEPPRNISMNVSAANSLVSYPIMAQQPLMPTR